MIRVMPYGRRAGLVPRRPENFGDGGAFPEVHVVQYPLSMGLHEAAAGGSGALAVTVDACGVAAKNSTKIVYTSHGDLVPKIEVAKIDCADADNEEEDEQAVTARTAAALEAILCAVPPASGTRFVKYRPARHSPAFNSSAGERIVRVEQAQEDPMLPPKHKRKRVPRPSGSPPVTVLHSPPRPASRKDMEDWRIPPSVSDWKNPKGYSIPLDKRVAADGRRMQEVEISHGFAGLSEALYVAEQKARESVETRRMVATELKMKKAEQREQELREIAKKARAEMASDAARAPPAKRERGMIREDRRRQREREASTNNKSASTRDKDRDISERIALGTASGTTVGGGEVAYDQRLFNQDRGMDSGFTADDQYNVYSQRLFAAQPTLSTLCRSNKHGESDVYGGDANEQLEKITETGRFKPDKGFSGDPERAGGKRERPVEFDVPEKSGEAYYDPFVELDQYINRMMEGKKQCDG